DSSKAGLVAELDELGTTLLTVAPGQTFGGQAAVLPEAAGRAVRNMSSVRSTAAVTAISAATVRRDPYIEAAETSGISLYASDPELLATLGGRVLRGRVLDPASDSYPLVVPGAAAAQRLGVVRLTVNGRPVQVYVGSTWFTVAGVLGPQPLAPEIERAALIGYPIAHRLFGTTRHASMLYVRADPERVAEAASLLAATPDP